MPRVLVIDDDEDVRTVLQRMLVHAGHEVTLAPGGKEALELLRDDPADMVITDIFMPGQDGIETILQIRSHFPRISIVAMCGTHLADPMLLMARRLGAVALLRKPFSNDELQATVEAAVPSGKKLVGRGA